jgi:hypothetical protein
VSNPFKISLLCVLRQKFVEFCRTLYDLCEILLELLLSVFDENCSICNQSRAEPKDTVQRTYMQLPFSPKLWHIFQQACKKVLKFIFQYVLYVLCSPPLYCTFILPLRKKLTKGPFSWQFLKGSSPACHKSTTGKVYLDNKIVVAR